MLHQPLGPPPAITRIAVMQGQVRVSADPKVELTTVLGSCVASYLFDAEARVGGMNHFLLAEPPSSHSSGQVDEHYGVYLMELLINEMIAQGASKAHMRGQLFGGANFHKGMAPNGSANAEFARTFLRRETIQLVREDLGGTLARRVDFRPARGLVRCKSIENTQVFDNAPDSRPARASGDVELF